MVMFTASIVAYHSSLKEIHKVIDCVLAEPVSVLYIIDNSLNDSLRELSEISDRIRYIHSMNLGYGAGHNIAIRKAIEQGSKYHVVINPDIYFETGTLERLVFYMEFHPDVGQIMPRVVYPNGELQYLCKMLPTPVDLIFKRFLPQKIIRRRLEKFQLRFTGYNKEMNIPYLSGCFMFFRVSAFERVGLFDERFFMYPEDIDITRRMHRYYKTMFYPGVTIIHDHAAASYQNRKMLKIHIINMIRYFNKWGWLFDGERRKENRKLLIELNYKKK